MWGQLKTEVMELRSGRKEGGGENGGGAADEKELRTMEGENYIISNHTGESGGEGDRRTDGQTESGRDIERGRQTDRQTDKNRGKERQRESDGARKRETGSGMMAAAQSHCRQCLSRRRPVGGGIMS